MRSHTIQTGQTGNHLQLLTNFLVRDLFMHSKKICGLLTFPEECKEIIIETWVK